MQPAVCFWSPGLPISHDAMHSGGHVLVATPHVSCHASPPGCYVLVGPLELGPPTARARPAAGSLADVLAAGVVSRSRSREYILLATCPYEAWMDGRSPWAG